jgi:diguanylate cyclase (GGDEF)-like protein/putative nucleotidyltransferase with HDIG domain
MHLADRANKGFYLLFVDLDKMKWINDNFGHHEGDCALKAIAAVCKESFRKSDVIGRLGGDEFAICAIEAKKDSAQILINRLRKNLDDYNKVQKNNYSLTLSIGTTYYDPNNPCSIEELLEQADKLMYKQKMLKHSPRVTNIEPKEVALDKPSRTEYVLKSDIVRILLMADDIQISQSVIEMIKVANTHRFEVMHVATLSTGLKYLGSEIVDVVLLDLNLKHCRQFEVFKKVYAQAHGVPIIAMIDHDDEDLAVKAIREGAQDCITKRQINSNLLVRSIKYAIERGYTVLELKNSFGKFQKVLEDTINALASIVENRDPYTAGHQKRVSELAQAIAKEMNLTADQTKGVKMAALIHDVGKTQIPEDILNKPAGLTDKEMAVVKTHPGVGYEILKTIKFPWLITQIVHQHHERMNGSGYPKGLAGKDILLESKILAVADVVEAMSSHRPYRPAPGIEKALAEIKQKRGKLYDPNVVDTCIKLFEQKKFVFKNGVKS